ncbi:MAG: sulfite exporter TauE/SafE family protein [Nitrospiraceae bacterium]|nr:MAG: sulfite exporter TauE/SafE family protein [Nitrospiraceae bacterium]
MDTGYLFVFTTGLLGSAGHCLGMCGPIVASYSMYDSSQQDLSLARRAMPHLLYNAGRILTYTLIGAVMGLAGSAVNVAGKLSGFQNAIPILAGVIMILMGISITGIFGTLSWLESKNQFIFRLGKKISRGNAVWKFFPLGLILGFLPCGLSYSAFAAAAGTGNFTSGMVIAALFGLGTLPAILVFGMAASYVSAHIRGMLYKSAGALVILTGIFFLIKGIARHG